MFVFQHTLFNGSVELLDIGNLIPRSRREFGGRYSYRLIAETSLGQHTGQWKSKLKGQMGWEETKREWHLEEWQLL